MTNDGRKHMRIALSADEYEKFAAEKAKVERLTKEIVSDSKFAVRLIRWAVWTKS